MAVDRKTKRSIYFTISTGRQDKPEMLADCPWNPGKSRNKFKEKR